MKKFSTVTEYISAHANYEAELNLLREIILSTELSETIKWGLPVYTLENKNIVGLGAFKSYVGLWFFQGVFLSDQENILVNAQKGKTKAMRQMRFTDLDDMDPKIIKGYIMEAIRNQKEGKEVKVNREKPLSIPDDLQNLLSENAALQKEFNNLSKSRKREYSEYISEAKREATRQRRLEKIKALILAGKGLHDKYR